MKVENAMDYLKVSIESNSAGAELLADALAGITGGCEVDDPDTVNQWAEDARSRWDYLGSELFENPNRPVTVNYYVANDEDGQNIIRQASLELARIKQDVTDGKWGSLAVSIMPMVNQDWETSWRQYFKPTPIGKRLLVTPSWEEIPEGEERIILTIDPSSSFGTGTHGTTQMCLELLETMPLEGKRLLDIGCGSGILACGALLLGAAHALCCDIEDNAMVATAENMERNHIGNGQYKTVMGDILSDDDCFTAPEAAGPYGLITANIVADVLIPMAGKLEALLQTGGCIVLSGILDERLDEVLAAYRTLGLDVTDTRHQDGWTAAVMTKV